MATKSNAKKRSKSLGFAVCQTFACQTYEGPLLLRAGEIVSTWTQSAAGGLTPHTFVVTSGALPQGYTLSVSGVLSGTTGTTGTFTFVVRANDALGCIGDQNYSLTITP